MADFQKPTIATLPTPEPDQVRAELEKRRRNLPLIAEHYVLTAKMRRAAYVAYIGEGFTPEQALELCKG